MFLLCVCEYPLFFPFSYIRYSAVCARVVRAALKPQFRVEAVKNAESSVRVNKVKTA
ncbi:ATP synthase subunit epsilon, mitochondrial [Astyanax mexicanus]|uniref:ATP synthase subunit epsilon, mitochondrial n=1 Tax=Astyanax mexicanus TaxID=7994 RepID=A0A8T2KJ45_ASTMX|nr:ATP synthase subunit epsilon, mitochondrial [Astyanax mexicanus]